MYGAPESQTSMLFAGLKEAPREPPDQRRADGLRTLVGLVRLGLEERPTRDCPGIPSGVAEVEAFSWLLGLGS